MQKLINCCAAYQALLQQHRDAANDDPAVEEDVLVENMTRLGSTVRAVDDMLDEIEQHLKVIITITITFAVWFLYFNTKITINSYIINLVKIIMHIKHSCCKHIE